MAVPFHYQVFGGAVFAIGALLDPLYWILCGICFYFDRKKKRYALITAISSVISLLYRFIVVPATVTREYTYSIPWITEFLGVILVCVIINGIFLGISRMQGAKKKAETAKATPPPPPAPLTVQTEAATLIVPEAPAAPMVETPPSPPVAPVEHAVATPPPPPAPLTVQTEAATLIVPEVPAAPMVETPPSPPVAPVEQAEALEHEPETEVSPQGDTPTAAPAQSEANPAEPSPTPSVETAPPKVDTAAPSPGQKKARYYSASATVTPSNKSFENKNAVSPERKMFPWRELLLAINLAGFIFILMSSNAAQRDLKVTREISSRTNGNIDKMRDDLKSQLRDMIAAQNKELRQAELPKPPATASPPEPERDPLTKKILERMARPQSDGKQQ